MKPYILTHRKPKTLQNWLKVEAIHNGHYNPFLKQVKIKTQLYIIKTFTFHNTSKQEGNKYRFFIMIYINVKPWLATTISVGRISRLKVEQ